MPIEPVNYKNAYENTDNVVALRLTAKSYGYNTRMAQKLMSAANEIELLRTQVAEMTGDNTTNFRLIETSKLQMIRQAISNLTGGTTCPCGAWIGQESERPHVSGCPVALALEYFDAL